jgi:hypothetical protein
VNAPKWHAPAAKVESTSPTPDRPSPDDRGGPQAELPAEVDAELQTEPVSNDIGVERIQGHGIIRRGNEQLQETDYDVIVTPAELRGTGLTFEAGSPLDRAPKAGPDIAGQLLGPFFQAQDFAKGIYTLVLEDGREFDFRVLQPDTNEIVGVSVLRSPGAPRSTPER